MEKGFVKIWDGNSETDCVDVCRDFLKSGIEYRVVQQPVERTIRMGVIWKFQVGVADTDVASAKKVLGLDAEVEPTIEIPEGTPTGYFV
jgi:hypothetical protein